MDDPSARYHLRHRLRIRLRIRRCRNRRWRLGVLLQTVDAWGFPAEKQKNPFLGLVIPPSNWDLI